MPSDLFPDGSLGHAGPELLGYLRAEPTLILVAYSPLLAGAYVREDKPLPPDYDHPGTPARLAELRSVARETGATVNQVVLLADRRRATGHPAGRGVVPGATGGEPGRRGPGADS